MAAEGLAVFAERGGRARWVTSPILETSDWDALYCGVQARSDDTLKLALKRNITDLAASLSSDTLNAIAWMVADGVLTFRLALPREKLSGGEFHDKFGIFTDSSGDQISFNGSYNDSIQGLRNYESIKVFCSWEPAFKPWVDADIERFERLWHNEDPNVRIVDLPDAAKEDLLKLRTNRRPYPKPPGALDDDDDIYGTQEAANFTIQEPPALSNVLRLPAALTIRPYQKDAIRAWSEAKGRGIFAMATGTGKTLTALTLATKLSEKNRPLVVIILCPFINLCRQWEEELAKFSVSPVRCYEGFQNWEHDLENAYQRILTGIDTFATLVVSNATFISEPFQKRIKPKLTTPGIHHFLIADEVHNLGASRTHRVLPPEINLRLGLSATPERHLDEEGTAALFSYFGDVVFEYSLAQAIADDRLCPYQYTPIPVLLTEDEGREYFEISQQLARVMPDDKGELGPAAMRLLLKRSRLLGSAEGKLVALDNLLCNLPTPPKKAIFYCGDGTTTDVISQEESRQIHAVAHLLGERHGLKVRTFTYRETATERELILKDLRSGFLDGIVAIRCLDEGIDLPDLTTGFLLASSTNPRQFVQRRGRLLRKAPGKDLANIYDFVIQPPELNGMNDDSIFNMERRLFQGELLRICEFCTTARNGPEALASLRDIRIKYNLLAV